MSTEQATVKARDAWKAVRELLEKAEAAANKGLTRAAPAVQKSIDASLEAAAKGFASTMKTIDSVTEKEQLELLKVYNRFLTGQSEFVQSRIKAMEEKGAKAPPAQNAGG
jgi:signal transduction protein with GAF and PtsI domain